MDLSNSQYLFIDFGIVFISSILVSNTAADSKVVNSKPNKGVLNMKFLSSVIGQTIIQVISIYVFFFKYLTYHIPSTLNIQSPDPLNPNSSDLTLYNSVRIYILIISIYFFSIYFN